MKGICECTTGLQTLLTTFASRLPPKCLKREIVGVEFVAIAFVSDCSTAVCSAVGSHLTETHCFGCSPGEDRASVRETHEELAPEVVQREARARQQKDRGGRQRALGEAQSAHREGKVSGAEVLCSCYTTLYRRREQT